MDLTEYRGKPAEVERVASLMALVPPGQRTVLDVGARDGYLSIRLADSGASVTALDLEAPVFRHERVTCVKGDVSALQFADASFDLVLCAEVLEHLRPEHLPRACAEIARVARHCAIIGVPYRQDTRVGRTTCGACGGKNPPWGHLNAFDEARLEQLFPALRIEKIRPRWQYQGGYQRRLVLADGPRRKPVRDLRAGRAVHPLRGEAPRSSAAHAAAEGVHPVRGVADGRAAARDAGARKLDSRVAGEVTVVMADVGARVRRRLHEGVNYRLRSLAGGRLASLCRPASPLFLLSERCNARCVHCDIWKNRGQEDSPTAGQWKAVLTDLRRWLGPVQVTFSGGEALLKPYTIELAEHASRLGLFLEVLTHGYWDDQEKIERLALAGPRLVTISLDGIGEVHSTIRGREGFFDKTARTIETFQRMRAERRLPYVIRLKTVIMDENLDGVTDLMRFGRQEGMENFLQPIEQNYNTPEDPRWFETSPNWPRDTDKAVAVVRELIEMKRAGYHISNSYAQLEAMIPYFRDPAALRVSTQAHAAHERRLLCAALTMLQFQANGDVTVCHSEPPVGNIKDRPIREIWERRPRLWEHGCCLERRLAAAEPAARKAGAGV